MAVVERGSFAPLLSHLCPILSVFLLVIKPYLDIISKKKALGPVTTARIIRIDKTGPQKQEKWLMLVLV